MELDPSIVCSRSRLNRAPTSASNYAAVLTECVQISRLATQIQWASAFRHGGHVLRLEMSRRRNPRLWTIADT